MKNINKLAFIFLILGSFFLTGCDAESLMQAVTEVAQNIEEAVPATQSAAESISELASGNSSTTTTGQSTSAEADQPSRSGTAVVSTTSEDLTSPTTSNSGAGSVTVPTNIPRSSYFEPFLQGAQLRYGYSAVGTESNLSEATSLKSKYGITLLDGRARNDSFATFASGNWTRRQISSLDRLLSRLPQGFRSCTTGFSMHDRIVTTGGREIGGYGFDPIAISADGTTFQYAFQHTIYHEMVHQFQARNSDVARLWNYYFWDGQRPKRSSISDYGNSNPVEDMAECVATYFINPSKLRRHDPERYQFIEQYVAR